MFEQKDIDRFWEKVRIGNTNECWPWLAGKFTNGYGDFKYKGKDYKSHIFAFMLTNDIILSGRDILIRHTCNNPPCCNPNHLIEGTQKDNMQDCIKANRYNSGNQKGINNPNSILTEDEVRKIKRLGWFMGATEISRMPEFKNKIKSKAIWEILNNITWIHIK